MLTAVLYSALAGIAGTGLGGLIGILLGDRGGKIINYVLGLTGGIMVSIVCFELVPESFETLEQSVSHIPAVFLTASGIVLGIAVTSVLDFFSHGLSERQEKKLAGSEAGGNGSVRLVGAGVIVALGVSLHNFPEGMALGVVTHDTLLVIAALLAAHNIPAGMSMSLPLAAGGMKKSYALIITAGAGAVTVLGAVAGALIGSVNEIANVVIISVASGALLYVAFCEILPHAFKGGEGHSVPLFALGGLILGFVITFLMHTH